MHKQTFIDVFKEMGFSGQLLLLLFFVLLVYGAVIHFRKLDQRWRKSFLIASLLPIAAGFFLFCCFLMENIRSSGNSSLGTGASNQPLLVLNGGTLAMGSFIAWLTIILLVFSAFLFITGKDKERRTSGTPEVERDDSSDSQAI